MNSKTYPSTYQGLCLYVADTVELSPTKARAAMDAAVEFISSTVLDHHANLNIRRLGTFWPRAIHGYVTLRFHRSWRLGRKDHVE